MGEKKISRKKAKIFLLGFAFKGRPPTSDVRGSTTYSLIERLKKNGLTDITGYDPLVKKDDIVRSDARHAARPTPFLKGSHVIVIMNNNPHFEELNIPAILKNAKRPVLFVDAWALYPKAFLEGHPHVVHYQL